MTCWPTEILPALKITRIAVTMVVGVCLSSFMGSCANTIAQTEGGVHSKSDILPDKSSPHDQQPETYQLLAKYCFACHQGDDAAGDVAMDSFDPNMTDGNDAEAWKSVLDQVNSGEMPPEEADQPSEIQRQQLVVWLTSALDKIANQDIADPTHGIRRLTRSQYTNTLQDLLGVSVNFGDVLPEEGKSGMGFSNSGNVLQTSSLHIDYWEQLARSALDKAIAPATRPDTLRFRVTFGKDIDRQLSTVSGAEVVGYQAIPVSNRHFKVEYLDENGHAISATSASERNEQVRLQNLIGIGMRGSTSDRFAINSDGMLLYSAVPHRETTPKSWQGPSPNLKILFRDKLPDAGNFRMRVEASRVSRWKENVWREGLISLRDPVPATVTAQTIGLHAAQCKSHEGMEIDQTGVLSPTNLPGRSFARYTLKIPEDGFYQIDLVHRWASPDRMPSLELLIDSFREQQRLTLARGDPQELEGTTVTTPVTLAKLKRGKHKLLIGGRFFVGFEKVLVTPLLADSPVAEDLRSEGANNRRKFAAATPTLRAFAGARTDDGMDYRTFGTSLAVPPLDDRALETDAAQGRSASLVEDNAVASGFNFQQLEFFGRIENQPFPFYDHDTNDPLANISIFGIWNDYLVKNRAHSGPPVLIRSIEVEAPWFPVWPPASHKSIFFDAAGAKPPSAAYTRGVLKRFVSRAFRRPATAAEIDRYMSFWNATKEEADDYTESVKEVLVAVLCSPDFLFNIDVQASDTGDSLASRTEYPLASRLSYFLWNSPPDESLLALARQGKLGDQIADQADRMLNDPRAWRMIRAFAHEWLRIDRHENIQTNIERYPDFTRFVRADMAEETFQFLHHVLTQNRPVTDLIDSDYAMLNQNLSEFYGIAGVTGPHFRAVPLKPGHQRGGLLSQGAFLSGHSDGSQAHPIKRAVWLKEKILGETPPPPPPNVPDLDPETPGFEELTLKQQLELHRDKPSCRNCHRKIDPYGIIFQNYDAVGRFQHTDKGKPIDSKSVLPDGTKIDGISEMKQYILTSKQDRFLTALVEHLFAWALGRDLRFSDEQEIAAIVNRIEHDGGTLRSVFRQIVLSDSFNN